MRNKQSLEGTVRKICWVAVVAQGLIKARSSSKQDQDRRRIQHWFRALDPELCRNIMETLWCFSKLFFLKLLLWVPNNQLCFHLLVSQMVKSVSSSVLLSALKWAYIAAFNFLFTGVSFRTSFHYPVVWNISQLVLFLPLFCSSVKQRVFPQTLSLSSSPTKAESTHCCIFIWMMQKMCTCTCLWMHWGVSCFGKRWAGN